MKKIIGLGLLVLCAATLGSLTNQSLIIKIMIYKQVLLILLMKKMVLKKLMLLHK